MNKIMKAMAVIICVIIIAIPAALPAIIPAGAVGTRNATTDTSTPVPNGTPGGPVQISDPALPTDPALDESSEYIQVVLSTVMNTPLDSFAMPDYKAVLYNDIFEAWVALGYTSPDYTIALDNILSLMPELNDWIMDDVVVAELNEEMETLIAIIFTELDSTTWNDVSFTTVAQGGYSGYKDDFDTFNDVQHYEMIRTKDGWKEFWNAHTSISLPPETPPTIDPNDMVLMAFLGVRTTGGYDIEITNIYTTTVFPGGSVYPATVVEVERWGPGTGNVPQVITNPNHIITIDKIPRTQPVIFLDTFTGNVIDVVVY